MEIKTKFIKLLLGSFILFCQSIAVAEEIKPVEIIPRESYRTNTEVTKRVYKILKAINATIQVKFQRHY